VFTINGSITRGDLNWNPNGSLQQLTITDPFNAADAQTCSYSADDLARIASVSCQQGVTNVWNQNFTYDAFGNINKTVPTGGLESAGRWATIIQQINMPAVPAQLMMRTVILPMTLSTLTPGTQTETQDHSIPARSFTMHLIAR
jgi:hypothetical protein